MAAFNPISPAAALELLADIGVEDKAAALVAFVRGGMVKAYASVLESADVTGARTEVRDGRIDRDAWDRVIAEQRANDIWAAGSVRLEGEARPGGRPPLNIIGIRFDERSVRKVASAHAARPAPAPKPAEKASKAAVDRKPEPVAAPVAPIAELPLPTPAPSKRGLPADVLCVSINEAIEILGVARSTIYNLSDRGELKLLKVGSRTKVDADSIRALLSVQPA